MATLIVKKSFVAVILAGVLAGALMPGMVKAQCANSGSETQCCSRFGFFREDPDINNGISIADIVTAEFFNGILNQSSATCAGRNFYSRGAFLGALNSFTQFARNGSAEDSRREIAAFFVHASHETGSFCYIEEVGGAGYDYCDETITKYPCNPNKGYYGRGPLQLTWNFNYGPAGTDIGFDGLNAPETVANDPVIAFKTALWFWMNNVASVMNQGFGATIRAINGDLECNGANPATVQSRINLYTQFCNQLGVAPGVNLSC